MMLTNRDKAIIKDLNKFRVMDRDSIAELHFSNLKNPQLAANNVLLRLFRDGQIQRSVSFFPYVYFGPEVQIKKNSQKISHFLAILDVYKELRKLGSLESFLVEPKYGNKSEYAEPDIYCFFRKTPFFIEVQRTIYSEKQMNDKLDRYAELFKSDILADKNTRLIILSEQRYPLDDNNYPFKIFQAESFTKFIGSLKGSTVIPEIKQQSIKRVVNS
ncbi:hypothetical protein [Heyndrickxia camelliae]|uniref:Uncharacterized protein n=1 Tax=Heyndrickxia camelliae TaxID=1707093 RepID=A0A2N3LCQ4_9BACI|nr:hypothetical protein [Heyndrickxia camelliae]PKR82440.1 hypothetical protein CWO92_24360 [Heyndrickxia camelliae]